MRICKGFHGARTGYAHFEAWPVALSKPLVALVARPCNPQKFKAIDRHPHAFLVPPLLDAHDARDAIEMNRPAGEVLKLERELHRLSLRKRDVSDEVHAACADGMGDAFALSELDGHVAFEAFVAALVHEAAQ